MIRNFRHCTGPDVLLWRRWGFRACSPTISGAVGTGSWRASFALQRVSFRTASKQVFLSGMGFALIAIPMNGVKQSGAWRLQGVTGIGEHPRCDSTGSHSRPIQESGKAPSRFEFRASDQRSVEFDSRVVPQIRETTSEGGQVRGWVGDFDVGYGPGSSVCRWFPPSSHFTSRE